MSIAYHGKVYAEIELRRRQFPRWLTGNAPPGWVYNYPYQEYLYERLERVTRGECKRLMVFMPPRHMKSTTVTIRYSAWRLLREPSTRIILGAYSQFLANKFSRDIRKLVRASGGTFNLERRAVQEWEMQGGGGLRAVGVGGGINGTGANLIIVDDPIKNRKEAESPTYRENLKDWYSNDLFTRQEPGCAIIIIHTRWHMDDLSGWLLDEAQHGGDQWEVVNLPALAEQDDPLGRPLGTALCPERFNEETLESYKRQLKNDFYALYQQRPLPEEGSIFKREWFKYHTGGPPHLVNVVQVWDTAMKAGQDNDYSACATMGMDVNGVGYLLNVWRGRVEMPDLLRQMRAQYERYVPNVVCVEDKQSGTSAIQTLRKETQIPIVPIQAEGDKVSRARLASPFFEGGRVLIMRGAFVADMEDELLSFPSGKNDDQVDAICYAALRLFGKTQRRARQISGRDHYD